MLARMLLAWLFLCSQAMAAGVIPAPGVAIGGVGPALGLQNAKEPPYSATSTASPTAAINAATAAAAVSGGTVRIPSGILGSGQTFTYTQPGDNVLWEADGPNLNRSMFGLGSPATDSAKVFHGVIATARPSGNNRALISDFALSEGSGANGANHGDFAHSFQEYKLNWSCSTAKQAAGSCSTVALQGEDDTLYLSLFQGGPDATGSASLKTAGGLMTGSANCINGIGFCVQSELQTNILDPLSLAIVSSMDIQTGGIDTRTGELSGIGQLVNATAGTQNAAYQAQNSGTGAWGNFLLNNYGTAQNFAVNDAGQIVFGSPVNPASEVVLSSTGGTLSGRTQTGNLTVMDGNALRKATVTKGGSVGLSATLQNVATPAWVSGTLYALGAQVQNGGITYQMSLNMVPVASTVAPTQTTGTATGSDGVQWTVINSTTDADVASIQPDGLGVNGALTLASIAQLSRPVKVYATAGGILQTAWAGSLALRTDVVPNTSGYGRELLVNESGGNGNAWYPVVTANDIAAGAQTVATGSSASTATPAVFRTTLITSVVAAGNGFSLNPNSRDDQVFVNAGGNPATIYPPSVSGTISGGAAGAAYGTTIPTGYGYMRFHCFSTTLCARVG